MNIASWNVNSLSVRLEHVLAWIAEANIDVLALQETKVEDSKFPARVFQEQGWHVVFCGQKTYNGVALVSREPLQDVCLNDTVFGVGSQQRLIAGTAMYQGEACRIIGVYAPNGQAPGSDKFAYKLAWYEQLRNHLAETIKNYPKLIICGDFNIAPTDADVHDPETWRDQILCTDDERAALKALCDIGLTDAFRLFEQDDKQFSWWDYRMMGFRRNHGLRIDLLLISQALATLCTASGIDKAPRRLERPSDHTPVWLRLGTP